VFHGVEPEAVAFGFVHDPHRGADEVGVHVFKDGIAVGAVEGTPGARDGGEIRIHVIRIASGLAEEERLVGRAAFGGAEVFIDAATFVREVDEAGERAMLHLPLVIPVGDVVPVAEGAVGLTFQVKIRHGESGIHIGRRAGVVAGDVEAAVVHDVVEIDADAEAVRGLNDLQQLCLGAVTGGHGAALVFVAEIEGVEHIIANGKDAAGLGRGWKPEAGVTGFGDFGYLRDQLIPVHIEQLEHRFAAGWGGGQQRRQGDCQRGEQGGKQATRTPGENKDAVHE